MTNMLTGKYWLPLAKVLLGNTRRKDDGLLNGKKLGRAYEYKMTKKGLERHNYFYEKRKLKKEIEQFKRRIDEEYSKLAWQKLLEARKD